MILHDSLGPVLAKARKGKRISQELVAEITEVSVWTIRNIECKYRIRSPICTAIQPHRAAHIAPL